MIAHAKRATRKELEDKINSFECGLYDAMQNSSMKTGVNDVEFDCENVIEDTDDNRPYFGLKLGPDVLDSGVPVVWAACGGDWEFPLAVCIYLGEDDNLHAYIPRSGNVYNKRKNSAYGNHNDYYPSFAIGWFDSLFKFKFNMNKLRKEASINIVFQAI